jgi:chromate transporter
MLALAYGVADIDPAAAAPWLHGLRITAVAVVALAVWSMARSLAPDRPRASIAVLGAIGALAIPGAWGQIAVIVGGGFLGLAVPRPEAPTPTAPVRPAHRWRGAAALLLFAALLFVLPAIAAAWDSQALRVFDAFYRTGSLVFGGGHVVLPLLRAEVVTPGWASDDAFLAGYGLAQAVPGPLFSYATYLGAVLHAPPHGWRGGLLCLAAIYLPSFLLVIGVLPYWDALRRSVAAQRALRGINAAVVGLLLAALYSPGWTSAIRAPADFALALLLLLLLAQWKLPPWIVVILGAAGGFGLDRILPLLA